MTAMTNATHQCACMACCPCRKHRAAWIDIEALEAKRRINEDLTLALEQSASLPPIDAESPFDSSVVSTKVELRDRFDGLSVAGSGAYSTVWKATVLSHPLNDRAGLVPGELVAIKRFIIASHENRLEHEREMLYRCGNREAHILPLLDYVAVIGAPPSLVLPYFVHQQFALNYMRMNLIQIQMYMRGLLTALEHLHQRGVMHRDVKVSVEMRV